MLNKYTPSKLHKYNPIVYTVEPVRTNLKQNKKVRNKDWFRGPVPPEVKEEGDSRVKGNIIFHA